MTSVSEERENWGLEGNYGLRDLINRCIMDALSEFTKHMKEGVELAFSMSGIPFDKIEFRATLSTTGEYTTTGYYNGLAVIEWKNPVVYQEGETLRFEWIITKFPKRDPLTK